MPVEFLYLVIALAGTISSNIMRRLSQRGQLELAGELQDLPTIETGTTSHKHLTHELGVSEWFITLHKAARDAGDTLPFWEQTSVAKYLQGIMYPENWTGD